MELENLLRHLVQNHNVLSYLTQRGISFTELDTALFCLALSQGIAHTPDRNLQQQFVFIDKKKANLLWKIGFAVGAQISLKEPDLKYSTFKSTKAFENLEKGVYSLSDVTPMEELQAAILLNTTVCSNELVSVNEWCRFGSRVLITACSKVGIYVLPTLELINILKEIIQDEVCLEVGCGTGIIGRHLNCILTDSMIRKELVKEDPRVPSIVYPADVKKATALEAVDVFNPDWVLACHVPALYKYDIAMALSLKGIVAGGSSFGVDYLECLKRHKNLILVGYDQLYTCFYIPEDIRSMYDISKIEDSRIINHCGRILTIYVFRYKA